MSKALQSIMVDEHVYALVEGARGNGAGDSERTLQNILIISLKAAHEQFYTRRCLT